VLGRKVLDEDECDLWLRAERIEDLRECFEATRRRADADDGNRRTDRFLAPLGLRVFFDWNGAVRDRCRRFARLARSRPRLGVALALGSTRSLHLPFWLARHQRLLLASAAEALMQQDGFVGRSIKLPPRSVSLYSLPGRLDKGQLWRPPGRSRVTAPS
jgi:hypothetical protein